MVKNSIIIYLLIIGFLGCTENNNKDNSTEENNASSKQIINDEYFSNNKEIPVDDSTSYSIFVIIKPDSILPNDKLSIVKSGKNIGTGSIQIFSESDQLLLILNINKEYRVCNTAFFEIKNYEFDNTSYLEINNNCNENAYLKENDTIKDAKFNIENISIHDNITTEINKVKKKIK